MSAYKLSTLLILSAAILVSAAMFTSAAWLWILAPLGMLAWLDLSEPQRSERKAAPAPVASSWGFYAVLFVVTLAFHFFGRAAYIREFPAVRTAPRTEYRPPLNAAPQAASPPNSKRAGAVEAPRLPPGSPTPNRNLNSTPPTMPAGASQRPVTPAAAAPTASRNPASSASYPPQTNSPAAPPAPTPPK